MKLLHIYRKTYHSHKLTIHIKCSPSCNYNTVICWEFHFGFRKTNLTNMVKETSSASCTTAISSWIPGPLKFSWMIMFWTFRVIYGLFTIVPKSTVQSSEGFFLAKQCAAERSHLLLISGGHSGIFPIHNSVAYCDTVGQSSPTTV